MLRSNTLKSSYATQPKVGAASTIILFCAFAWIGFEGFWTAFFDTPGLNFVTHIIIFFAFSGALLSSIKRSRIQKGMLYLMLFIALLACTSVLGSHSKGPDAAIVAVLLYLKIAYIFLLAKTIRIEKLATLLAILATLHILGAIASYIFYDFFFLLRSGDDVNRLHRILGLQLNPNALAFFSASLALFFIFVRRGPIFAVLLIAIMLWSGSRSALIFFLVASIYLGWIEGRMRGKLVILAAVLVGALGATMYSDRSVDTLEKADNAITGDGLYVRAAMLVGGYRLALQNFPFGSGGGTFGSPLGTDMATYRDASIAHLPKVQDGSGIHDSGVGSLLGEYGFVGAVIVLALLVMLTIDLGCRKLTKTDVLLVVFLVVALSFARGIVSSYFYSMFIAFFSLMVVFVRDKRAMNHE